MQTNNFFRNNSMQSHLPKPSVKVFLHSTVKPALSGQLQIDKTKILMTNGSLMKVESIAECSLRSIPFGAFCNTFDLH